MPLVEFTVAGALVESSAGVLLVQNRRRNGAMEWSTPGGVIDASDATVLSGLAREVEEETGLVPQILGLTGRYSRTDGSAVVVFAARVADSAEPGGPRNEIEEQRWVRHGKALRLLSRKARRRLVEALAFADGVPANGLTQRVG